MAFMPEILGAFEQSSNGSNDCYMTTPISNYRLPEVNFGEAQWHRHTWRETNKVRNALSRLHVEPYDALYVLDAAGVKKLDPLKKVLEAITAVETSMITSLTKNKPHIASSAANLRWMVVETLKKAYRDMDAKSRTAAKHQVRTMVKSVFSDRYRRYEKLPFATRSYQNNEVWNGTDYMGVFHQSVVLSGGIAATADTAAKESRTEYIKMATEQEEMNIEIATTSMSKIGQIYAKLIDSFETKGNNTNTLLDAIDADFKKMSLEAAGLTGTPATINLSTGALMLDLQKATGTFLWELLLERLEIFRSNVFSYFSITTHDKENPTDKNHASDKRAGLNSAADMTDSFMEKAVPACLSHLFESLCPAFEVDLMKIDPAKRVDFASVVQYFTSMRLQFPSLSTSLFGGIRVNPFTDFYNPTATPVVDSGYTTLARAIENAMVDRVLNPFLKSAPNLRCLKIESIFENIAEQWGQTMLALDFIKLERQFVSGAPEHHPLKQYPNRARDRISEVLLRRMAIVGLETDHVFGVVCKLLYANYCADGAFVALIANDAVHHAGLSKTRFVRRYYRAAHNPIALDSAYAAGASKSDFPSEKIGLVQQSQARLAFEASYDEIVAGHPLLKFPTWLSTYAKAEAVDKAEDTSLYTNLFDLKRSANPPLIRAAKPSQANNNKPKQAEQAKKAKQPSQTQPQQPKKANAGGGGAKQTPRANSRS